MDIINAMKLASHGVKMTRLYWLDLVRRYPDNPEYPRSSASDSCPVYFVYNEEYEVVDVYNRYKELIRRYANKFNPFPFEYSDIMADDYIVYRDELLDEVLNDAKE